MQKQRQAFTLIELLVVITILAIVATIGFQVSGALSTQARINATNVTLAKIDTVLRERYEAVVAITPKKLSGAAKANFVKNALIRYMPQVDNDFDRTLNTLGYFNTSDPDSPWLLKNDPLSPSTALTGLDPAELLHEMVTQKAPFSATKFKLANKNPQELTPSEVGDTDGDGNLEILDAWGTPIRFYRWPTRLLKPAGSTVNGLVIVAMGRKLTSQEINVDPLDPYGLNLSENIYNTRNTFSRPMAISAGPDRQFGLADYTVLDSGTPIYGHLASPAVPGEYGPIYDNLTSVTAKVSK